MKPSFGKTSLVRNLSLSMGIGVSLGLGLLGFSAYSSSQASSSPETSVAQPSKVMTSDEGRSPQHSSPRSPVSKQVIPAETAEPVSTSPTPLEASTIANQALEHTLSQQIPGIATCPFAEASPQASVPVTTAANDTIREHHYTYHPVDLNGDRQNELIVQVMGPMTCGTGGCTTFILQESADGSTPGYDVVTQMSVVNFPIIVSDRTSSGWNDLLVMVSGGGAQPGYRQLKFDGQSYPSNPSMEAMIASDKGVPDGKVLMVSEDIGAIAPVVSASDCDA